MFQILNNSKCIFKYVNFSRFPIQVFTDNPSKVQQLWWFHLEIQLKHYTWPNYTAIVDLHSLFTVRVTATVRLLLLRSSCYDTSRSLTLGNSTACISLHHATVHNICLRCTHSSIQSLYNFIINPSQTLSQKKC